MQTFLTNLSKKIVIDLGTANIRVWVKGQKSIIKEPSIIALNTNSQKVLSVGEDARRMIGRTPTGIRAVQPLKKGVISDFLATEALISFFIKKVNKNVSIFSKIFRPTVVIGVPTTVTEVEINSVVDSAKSAGAGKVYIVEEPIAAAIGSGIKIESSKGNMIVDIGGGTTDIAIISLGGIVKDSTIRIGGDEMDQAIVEYIKNKYNLLIGVKLAEDIKVKYGSAISKSTNASITISGQDLLNGLPKSTKLSSNEITESLLPIFEKILNAIKEALEVSPPELVADILEEGIFLSGGGAMIENIDKYFSSKLKVPCRISKNSSFAVVEGMSKMLEDISLLESYQIKDLILK